MRIVCILLWLVCYQAIGQVSVEGYINDELDQALPFALIQVQGTERGTVSSINGYFSVKAKLQDTLLVSFVGYKRLCLSVTEEMIDRDIKIKLAPEFIQLPSLWVYANRKYLVPERHKGNPMEISGVEKKASTELLKPGDFKFEKRPAQLGEIPMFGLGLTIYGPFTYFSEKEKRKAAQAYIETKETIVYRKFINRTEIRDSLKVEFQIDENRLEKGLIAFNERKPHVQKSNDEEDIWHNLVQFFDQQRRAGAL